MKKSSAKSISCITYTLGGNISAKLAGMTILTRSRHPHRRRRTGSASNDVNHFSDGIENRQPRFKRRREKFIALDEQKSERISCKVCKSSPPFSARVPAMIEIISQRQSPAGTEWTVTAMVSCLSVGFHFDQRLIRVGCHRCHTAAMNGMAERKEVGNGALASAVIANARERRQQQAHWLATAEIFILCPRDTHGGPASGRMPNDCRNETESGLESERVLWENSQD